MKSWEKNVWGIYDFSSHTKLAKTVAWFIDHGCTLKGDICEFGVFKGKGLLAWALLCKELGVDKKVIGFDSFSGFPPIYHEKDQLEKFGTLHDKGEISTKHYQDSLKLKEIREIIKQVEINVMNISSSEDFSNNTLETLYRKIEMLKLDNIELAVGDFNETMVEKHCDQVCLALFDCDLYESYHISLAATLPRLVAGGVCYLDEYYSLKFPGARIAVNEVINKNQDLKLKLVHTEDDGFERWHITKRSSAL